MKIIIKTVLKRFFNSIGLDIIRARNSPRYNVLGLRSLPIKTVIDVGANAGQFARYITNIFPDIKKMYCFEPQPEPYKQLHTWASRRQYGQVTAINAALGDKNGQVDMYCHTDHSPSSSLLETTELTESLYPFTRQQSKVPVRLTTLDNEMTNIAGILAPDLLIKLDVQGFEDRVIRGGKETFKIASACVLEVCLDQLYHQQANLEELLLLLKQLGFHYAGNLEQWYADDGHVLFIDAVFIR